MIWDFFLSYKRSNFSEEGLIASFYHQSPTDVLYGYQMFEKNMILPGHVVSIEQEVIHILYRR